MPIKIAVLGQKGGSGKSTISRLIACAYAKADYDVLLADMDTMQGTSTLWNARRLENEIKPELTVIQSPTLAKISKLYPHYDVVIFDGSPRATALTDELAKACDLIVLPTGLAVDDLHPTIVLANTLAKSGQQKKISLCFCRVGSSESELSAAIEYVGKTPYHLLDGMLYERTAYRRSMDYGLSVLETSYSSLNEKADNLATAIHDRLEVLGNANK